MKKFLYIMLIVNCSLPIVKSQWTQLPNLPVSGTVWDMYFINQTTGWMTFNTTGTILKTNNGGLNWIQQTSPAAEVYDIQFFNDTLGIALSYLSGNRLIIKTTNGGNNWNQVYSTGYPLFNMDFVNQDTGWVCGTDGFLGGVWHTTDGGVSFQRQLTGPTGTWGHIFFLKEEGPNSYNGWVAQHPVIYKTTNSGINWFEVYSGFGTLCDGSNISDLYFKDTSNGIITRTGNCFNITTNGGYNWVLIDRPNTASSKIAMGSGNTGWLSMTADTVIKTTNFFQTYGLQKTPISVNKLFAVDTSVVYGATNETRIIKTTNGGGNFVKVELISSKAPNSFKLYQNYPNPFNPKTTIEFSVSKSTYIDFKIYDILGQMVIEIYNNKYVQAGTYKLDLDFSTYPSGVYLYTLQTEDFRETKKLIYVK